MAAGWLLDRTSQLEVELLQITKHNHMIVNRGEFGLFFSIG